MNNAMYYLSVVTVYGLLWCCCAAFIHSLRHKEGYRSKMLIGAGVWIIGSGFSVWIQVQSGFQSVVWMVNGTILCIGLLWYTCRERKSTILYCSIWIMLSTQMMVEIWDIVWLLIGQSGVWYFLVVWGMFCIWVLHRTLIKWLPGSSGYDVGPRKLTLSVATFLAFQASIIFMEREGIYIFFSPRNLLLVTIQIYCITVLYMQNALFQKSAMRQELDTMNLLWRQQEEQYELSRENIALINRKCHDLKHQIAAIRAMGSSEERDKYIKELQKSLNIYDSKVVTGNEVLDTILTEKSLYCEAHDIKINCVVDGKQMAFLDPVDLYTIIGNAVDNAIESVEQIKEQERRIIDVLIHVRQKFLVINIINPLAHAVSFEDGMPLTTKEKNGYHGFGTKSIRHTVQKYNGHTSFNVENGCFVLKILFPLQQN